VNTTTYYVQLLADDGTWQFLYDSARLDKDAYPTLELAMESAQLAANWTRASARVLQVTTSVVATVEPEGDTPRPLLPTATSA
jgi:hypothetical protein